MNALSEIINYFELDECIGTAGQPSEQQLAALVNAGYRVVINLGLLDPRYCLTDEAASVTTMGMTYHHVPVEFTEPKASDYARFEAVLDDALKEPHGGKVFVHCAMNYRVTAFLALYAERHLGFARERADALFRRFWEPNEVWTRFVQSRRDAD